MQARRLSVRTLIFLGGAVLMLAPALVAGAIYTRALQQRAEALLLQGLGLRGELSAAILARRLNHLWRGIEQLALRVDLADLATTRRELELASQLDQRHSWLGVTDTEGRVLAAAERRLEGESVAQRPWFRLGLTGPAAIDVHEAHLLARLLPAAGEPLRFIDFAAPIRSRDGSTVGVIGAHLDWRWIVDTLSAMQTGGVEVLLLSRERVVLFGPPDLVNRRLAVGTAQAAGRVASAVLEERWPDGRDYLAVVVPTVAHAGLPSFGWSLIVRQEAQTALGSTRELIQAFWFTLGAGALVALLLLALGAHWVSVPARRLAADAEALLRGDTTRPYAETRYMEAARLSNALARLKARTITMPHEAPQRHPREPRHASRSSR